jgi:beta-lactamase superfamily II metal-dependent hydrolase
MAVQGEMILRVWDVEHGACAMLHHLHNGVAGRLAMIDSGCTPDWTPSKFIKNVLCRTRLDYLFITNADQDHMSDLQGLWDEGIEVINFGRNPSYTEQQYREIKLVGGPLTADAKRYATLCTGYRGPATEAFDDVMGGIKVKLYWPKYPFVKKTNDLSLAVLIDFAGFTILFPGDLEEAGWQALLTLPDFHTELSSLDILVASHHGRSNGFCEEVFKICKPTGVAISDKEVVHET